MLSGRALDAAIARIAGRSRPLRHTYYRAMALAHARDPLGKTRPIAAQRFNRRDGSRVLYLGDDPTTCLQEAVAAGFLAAAIAIIPVRCRLQAVVDLRLPHVQRRLGPSSAGLMANFRALRPPAPTQALGEACAAHGRIDGLIYESPARPGHHDLAVFESALAALGSRLIVEDPSGLADSLP